MAGEKIMSGQMRIKLSDKTIYHSTSASLSYTRATKERITKDTNGREQAKGILAFSLTCDALGVYDSDGTTAHDFEALFTIMNDDTDVKIPVEFVPDEGDATFKLTGEGIMNSLGLNAPVDEDTTASIQIDGGRLTLVALPVI